MSISAFLRGKPVENAPGKSDCLPAPPPSRDSVAAREREWCRGALSQTAAPLHDLAARQRLKAILRHLGFGEFALRAFIMLAFVFGAPTAKAEQFPSEPIHLVVPYPAGGSSDAIARVISDNMSTILHTPIVVDNRPGAAAVIGTKSIVRARPDGYTLLLGSVGAISVSPLINPKIADYDPSADFTAISFIARAPAVLVVPASSPARTVQDLIKLGAESSSMNYPSSGVGSASHLAGEMFNRANGTHFVNIPYKGASDQLIDLIAGRVQMGFFNAADVAKYVQQGQLRGLLIFGNERSLLLPEVPTNKEEGISQSIPAAWFALMGPAHMSPDVVRLLNAACQQTLQLPQVKGRLAELGLVVSPSSVEDTAAAIVSENAAYAKLIKEAGISAQ